jgi:Glycosyltransferase family 87
MNGSPRVKTLDSVGDNGRAGSVDRSDRCTAPYYVKALAMGIPAYLIGVHLWTWILMSPFYLGGHSDFRQIYAAASMVRTGHRGELYDLAAQERTQNELVSSDEVMPFVRPAYELLLFVPISLLHYRSAYSLFLALNLVMLALIYRLLRPRLENLAAIFPWFPASLFLGFLPVAAALIQGQDSILVLLILTVAFLLLNRKKQFLSGVVVGFALFKFQIIIPLAVIFLLWKRWSFFKGFAFSGGVVSGISVWITGRSQVLAFVRILLFVGGSHVGHGYPILTQRMANLHGLIFGLLGGRVSALWIPLLTLLASMVLLIFAARAEIQSDSEALLVALVASTLLSYYLFIHDLSVLLLPLVLCLNRSLLGEAEGEPRARLRFRIAALAFVSPLLISYAGEYFYLAAVPFLHWMRLLVLKRDGEYDTVALASSAGDRLTVLSSEK